MEINSYVITEYYIRWPIAIATPLADAETTTKVSYREIFCTFDLLASHFANKIKTFANL